MNDSELKELCNAHHGKQVVERVNRVIGDARTFQIPEWLKPGPYKPTWIDRFIYWLTHD